MKLNELVFKFEEDKNEFSFSENLCLIDNKKLIKNLSRENIKNGNSSLIIKSMNDLGIPINGLIKQLDKLGITVKKIDLNNLVKSHDVDML